MKKIFSSVTIMFVLLSTVKAQNTSPYWSLAGNSNATATSKLGTTNAIPLRLFTNNVERLRIQTNGRVGIGTTNPLNIFSVKATAGSPATSWVPNTPVFTGFAEAASSELDLATASNTFDLRPVFSGKRSRGTLAAPAKVANNDYIASITGAAYDGSGFLSPAAIHFYVDGTPTGGHVPARISFETGTNRSDRLERLKILNNGDFDFNNGQIFLQNSSGDVGIGTSSPSYKLHVVGTVYGLSSTTDGGVYGAGGYNGVQGYASGGLGFGYGVSGQSSYTGVTGSGGSYGVSGYCTSTSSGFGVYGQATDNQSGIGVYGQGYYGVKALSNTLYGVDGTGYYVGVVGHGSNSNSFSYGTEGYGNTQGNGGYFTGGHIGVQGYASTSSSSNYGVYGSGNGSAYAGYFSGTVFATTYTGSDRKLKKNIEDVSTALNIINQLHPKVYEFRQDGRYQYMHLPQGKHYGLIAQELEQVLPGMVKDTKFDTRIELEAQAKAQSDGAPNIRNVTVQGEVIDFKAVNYTELIPIIIKAMQEQQQQIENQQQKIEELNQQLSQLLKEKGINSSLSSIILEQNSPNPYNHSTSIRYGIPSGFVTAEFVVTDITGKRLKQIKLSADSGIVNLDASLLSSGAYSYSLVIDGKVADTKKMVVAK